MPERKSALSRMRLYVVALAVLGLGMCAALLIYSYADEAPGDAIGYIVVDLSLIHI